MYRRYLFFFLSACLVSTGCTTMTPPIGDIFSISNDQGSPPAIPTPGIPAPGIPALGMPVPGSKAFDPASAPGAPSFIVEMRSSNGKSQKFKRPLLDEATYVQKVLVESNALKEFGRVRIELWRPRPDGNGLHKLDVDYDRKLKSVPPGYDYAIRDGDRLIITKDESTMLDDMLGSLIGG